MVIERIDPQHGTVVLPEEIRRDVEYVEIVRRADGVIELRPQHPAESDQSWFWSERWHQMEREADADIAAGRVRTYDDLDAFIANLEASV